MGQPGVEQVAQSTIVRLSPSASLETSPNPEMQAFIKRFGIEKLMEIANQARNIVRQLYEEEGITPKGREEPINLTPESVQLGGSFGRGPEAVKTDTHEPDIDVTVQFKEYSDYSLALSVAQETQAEADKKLQEQTGETDLPPIHILLGYGDYSADGDFWG